MQSADPARRQELRKMSKKNGETAGVHTANLLNDILSFQEDKESIDNKVAAYVADTVWETTSELTGEKWLEKQMKKSCVNRSSNN